MSVPPAQLVTVSSGEFLLGTRVMLHSFLAANPWFQGEIVVLHARLDRGQIALLESSFTGLTCRTAGAELSDAVERLVAANPGLADRRDRFLSLETLLLPGSWPRLFIDSDVVVCGDLSPILAPAAALVACPDASMLRGRARDPSTFAEIAPGPDGNPPSFNAGMMLVREPLGDPLAQLSPESWRAVASDHTDQIVWNRLYRGHAVLADPAYNFMLGHAALYGDNAPAAPAVLHFNGRAKPWLPDRQAAAVARGGIVAAAFGQWREACKAMLAGQP